MANREDIVVNKGNLLCSICLEPFTRPRILPCLHSFCHLCLEEYIKVSVKILNAKGFECPVCRMFTPAPVHSLPEHEWANGFPENLTLVATMDGSSVEIAQVEHVKQRCDSCFREDIEVEATSYCLECEEKMCSDCKRYHQKSKASSKHVLGSIEDSEEHVKVLNFLQKLNRCSKHPSKKFKYVCEDHDEFCCGECTTLHHRKCDNVVSIAEKAQTCASDSRTMATTMKELESHAELLLDGERKQLTTLDEARDKTKASLSEVKQNVLDTFEELSRKTLEKMQSEDKDISAKTLDNINALGALKIKIKVCREKLEKVMAHGNEGHIYMYSTQLKKDLNQFSDDMRNLQNSLKREAIDVDVKPNLTEMLNWVNISRQTLETQVPQPPVYLPGGGRETQLKSHISTPFSYIRSCVWQNENRIFVCDNPAGQIAAYEVDSKKCLWTYKSPSSPGSIVKINDSLIAVSCPGIKIVLIMSMKRAKPCVIREIKTESQPWGLAYNDVEKYLLVQSKNGTVSYVRQDGTRVGSLPVTDTATLALETTQNIAFNSKTRTCYIASIGENKVMAIDRRGQIQFEYAMHYPFVISIGPDDDIYVCSYGGNSIHQLSPSGHLARELLTANDDVKGPLTISFNNRKDQFIVTMSGNKTLRVYDLVDVKHIASLANGLEGEDGH